MPRIIALGQHGGMLSPHASFLIVQKEDMNQGSMFMGLLRTQADEHQYLVVNNAETALQVHFEGLRQDVIAFTSHMFPSGAMSASDAIESIRSGKYISRLSYW